MQEKQHAWFSDGSAKYIGSTVVTYNLVTTKSQLLGKVKVANLPSQRHDFADKGLSSQGYGFSSSRVWM